MICIRRALAILFLGGFLASQSGAQTPSPSGSEESDLLSLSRKIDAQNVKIDLLSQQILRLQQEIEHPRANLSSSVAPAETSAPSAIPVQNGSTHVVAKGETLTSIARMHKVSIEELQKFNHIENDRKLQIGQTLVIPGVQTAAPSPAPSASSPNE